MKDREQADGKNVRPHKDEANVLLPRIAVQAFCLTPILSEIIETAKQDRRLARVQLRIQMGGVNAAIEAFRSSPSPNLIVVEFRADEVESLPYALDQLSEHCDPVTKVIVIGPINDVPLYREVIRRGVSDYLVLPLTAADFIAALSDLYRPKSGQSLGRCVAFIPTKGGCGSSTLAQNVSWMAGTALSVPVVLIDADLAFGTAALNVNQDPFHGLVDILTNQDKPDANMIDRSLCKVSDYLSLLASAPTLDRAVDIHDTSIDDLMDTMRSIAPLTIFDVPHQWTPWVRRLITLCDDVILVAEPDLASLRNTKQILENTMRLRSNDRPPAIFLNRLSLPKRPEIPAEEFLKPFQPTQTFSMAFDAQLFGTAANNGQMLVEAGASKIVQNTLLDVARYVTARSSPVAERTKSPITNILTRLTGRRG